MLQPLSNHLYFIFDEDVTSTRFVNKTQSGLLIAGGTNNGDQANIPRWGTVISAGPEVLDVQPGDHILVEAGMWTQSFETDGIKLWKTDEDKVIATSDEAHSAY